MQTPATPQLLAIDCDGPVRVRNIGQGGLGYDRVVNPEDFPWVIDMVNQYGGPAFWRITPA